MANRNLLHFSHLTAFHEWMLRQGYQHYKTPLEAYYEVARYRHVDRVYPVILFQKDSATEHFSCHDRDVPLIKQFLTEHKALLQLFS